MVTSKFGICAATVLLGLAAAVAPANQPPVAVAGPSRYIGAAPLTLDGTASSDPDPGDTIVSYVWTQVSGTAITLTNANTATPTVTATPTSTISTAVLQLVVSDGQSSSTPATVQLTIVAAVQSSIQLTMENPPFDVNKPTAVFFAGGNCNTGGGAWGLPAEWQDAANIISFVYGPPYDRCADALLAYLSRVAPQYSRPIQTSGHSTGGMPAIDAAIRINKIYKDPRYAINIVNLLDAACRTYDSYIVDYISNPVGDETAWVQNFYSSTAGYATFRPRALNVQMVGDHGLPPSYYIYSIYPELFTTDIYNHGMVAGVFTSVLQHGANYRIPNLTASPYYFTAIFDTSQTCHLVQSNATTYPGRLPQPITLSGPDDGAVVPAIGGTGGCTASENAVAYDVFFGTSPSQMSIRFTSPSPPLLATGFLPPDSRFYWTIQARDGLGTSYRADVRSFSTAPGLKVDINADGQVDAGDCAVLHDAFGTTWGGAGFQLAADYNADGTIDCVDYYAWLSDYRAYYHDPAKPDPCGFTDGPDSDGDGITDSCDQCPGTIPDATVDFRGCPPAVPGDFDRDGDVDQSDFGHMQACLGSPNDPACQDARLNTDGFINATDMTLFLNCRSGADVPADPNCSH